MRMVVICIIFVVGLMYFISVLTWHDLMDKTAPVLTFKAFRELYALNPHSWDLWLDYVRYSNQRIEFAKYTDVIKYNFFRKKIVKDKQKLERIKNEKEFLKHIQRDIDAYRRKNIEEMEKHLQK